MYKGNGKCHINKMTQNINKFVLVPKFCLPLLINLYSYQNFTCVDFLQNIEIKLFAFQTHNPIDNPKNKEIKTNPKICEVVNINVDGDGDGL